MVEAALVARGPPAPPQPSDDAWNRAIWQTFCCSTLVGLEVPALSANAPVPPAATFTLLLDAAQRALQRDVRTEQTLQILATWGSPSH